MQDSRYGLPRIPIPRNQVNKGNRKDIKKRIGARLKPRSSYVPKLPRTLLQATWGRILVLSGRTLARLVSSRVTLAGTIVNGREGHARERHRQRQHQRRDQQRNALSHLLTSSPFSPTRKPAYLFH